MKKIPENGSVLIIGGGIGGICAALSLAEIGIPVILVEKSPALGGVLSQLDRQFPNDHCGICRMLPMVDRDDGSQFCVRRGVFHRNMTVFTSTRVAAVEGGAGGFSATLHRSSEGVDPEKCTGCGHCMTVCPVSVPDEFNGGLGLRKAIHIPVPARIPASPVIDWEACTRCGECAAACRENAVRLDHDREEINLPNIAGIIVATGTPLADPGAYDVYGTGSLENVVTATAFERMISSTGPWGGNPVRPSDGGPIGRIAWIQCVGSRNVMIGADYCSSICCMFAVKEALLAKEKLGPETDTTIFYMDMRTFGRDFQRYRDAAEHAHGVKFVRCRVHSMEMGDRPGDVRLCYVDKDGAQVEADFDLAVLSTGRKPGRMTEDAALEGLAGEGVEMLDGAQELTDIAATVISANRAAVRVGAAYHAPGDPAAKAPAAGGGDTAFQLRHRICVVLCHHGENGASNPLRAEIETALNRLPGDVAVTRSPAPCGDDDWSAVTAAVDQSRANRLVLVADKPYALWPQITSLYDAVGMLPSQVEVVDTRMTPDAVRGIEMAVNRLRTRRPRSGVQVSVSRAAVVVGGGPAGLSAALALARWNIPVVVVEKTRSLGGNMARIKDGQTREMIQELVNGVEKHPIIDVHYGSTVAGRTGSPGRFHTVIRTADGKETSVDHGVFVIATGGGPADTDAYAYGTCAKIRTQFELEDALADQALPPLQSVVMIQCAGSREEPRNYCSRICCIKALKNAIALKARFPEADVTVFYRDMMTYGDSEQVYTEARREGVLFIPFDPAEKPGVVVEGEDLTVEAADPVLGKRMQLRPDLLVLSTGIKADETGNLQSVLGFEKTRDGFVKEADSKWRPLDTGKEGVYVCGLARNPVKAQEAMAEGEAAARRALRILLKDDIIPQRSAARVRHALCSRCELCIAACMYGARIIDAESNQIAVDPASCQGCGTCAAVCPNSATVIGDFEDDGVMGAIEAALD